MATPIPSNQARFSFSELTQALDVPSVERDGTAIGVVTDSRKVVPGCVYVALVGESFDGHQFAAAAAVNGAAVIVAEVGKELGDTGSAVVLRVQDTLIALGALARAHLRRLRAEGLRVVAITGSAGKTTTKELVAALLRLCGPTEATLGNLNNRIGLPCTALAVARNAAQGTPSYLVLEAGMSLPGEMMHLASIAEPDVALLLNVGYAHTEGVGGIDGVAKEKGALLEAVSPRGTAVVFGDDPRICMQGARSRGRVMTFGAGDASDVQLLRREPEGGAMRLSFRRATPAGPELFSCLSPLPGAAQAMDFAAALLVAEAASGHRLSAEECERALSDAATHLHGRATLRRVAGDVVVIDDTYNANPESMIAGLSLLAEVGAGRRRVAILGEMRELGAHAEDGHDRVARALVEANVDVVISCGGLADRIVAYAEAHGIEGHRCRDSHDTANFAASFVRDKDAILVKASRSITAEVVVERLLGRQPGAL